MTILTALSLYYDRMSARGEAEPPGFSREKISYALVIDSHGAVVDVQDIREMRGKKPVPVLLPVPSPQRTSNVMPNFLWDKTAYLFGVTAGDGRRTAREHEAFRQVHLDRLSAATDPDLIAFRRFVEQWTPSRFAEAPFKPDMLDANFVVDIEGARRYIHESEAANQLVAASSAASGAKTAMCLVTGVLGPITRLHPNIKNVRGAQSSGAPLVSVNAAAFESFGQKGGECAPTSEAAAFRYGNALNRLLAQDSANRLQIGDATTVFWAEAGGDGVGEVAAKAGEDFLHGWFEPPALPKDASTDGAETAKLRDILRAVEDGRPLADIDPHLVDGTRIHVLGLSPNAARLSVRFWLTDDLRTLTRRIAAHWRDTMIEPLPWRTPPSINRLLVKTVTAQEKFENIPPLIAGEMTRAVLSGGPYPRMLLSQAIMRLRAGDDASTGWHAAAIKACINRTENGDASHGAR